VVQLQAQIRHAAAVPNRPQDTANAMAPAIANETAPRRVGPIGLMCVNGCASVKSGAPARRPRSTPAR
jgi:hypothetical protein